MEEKKQTVSIFNKGDGTTTKIEKEQCIFCDKLGIPTVDMTPIYQDSEFGFVAPTLIGWIHNCCIGQEITDEKEPNPQRIEVIDWLSQAFGVAANTLFISKWCSACKQRMGIDEFWKYPNTKTGFSNKCRSCEPEKKRGRKGRNHNKSKKIKQNGPEIYFILCENHVKIGISEKISTRLSSLQCSNPYKLKLLLHFEGTEIDEAELHEKFEKHATRGEWFEYSDEIKEFIEKKKKGNNA